MTLFVYLFMVSSPQPVDSPKTGDPDPLVHSSVSSAQITAGNEVDPQ